MSEAHGSPSPALQTVLVQGLRIAYRRSGTGEPAVFVHGLGGASTNWTDLVPHLPLDAVAIDLPGFGHSDPLPGRASLGRYAEVVACAIEALFPAQPVHVVGNSLGADIVLDLVAARPGIARSVTLISPALPQRVLTRANRVVPLVASPILGRRALRRWSRFTPEQRTWGTINVVYGTPAGIRPERFREMVAETILRDSMPHALPSYQGATRALLVAFLRFGRRGLWRRMGSVSVPLLVIHGRRDVLVSSRQAHRVNRECPGASVALIMRSAHVSQLEFPAETARLWQEYVGNAVRRPGPAVP